MSSLRTKCNLRRWCCHQLRQHRKRRSYWMIPEWFNAFDVSNDVIVIFFHHLILLLYLSCIFRYCLLPPFFLSQPLSVMRSLMAWTWQQQALSSISPSFYPSALLFCPPPHFLWLCVGQCCQCFGPTSAVGPERPPLMARLSITKNNKQHNGSVKFRYSDGKLLWLCR